MVSVITCTFNRAAIIGETIASVLAQSFTNFEYIIIDDGSTDATEAVVNSFQDARIRYFRHLHTGGHLSVLRNFAHSKSSGKYIAYVDSDDLWEKDKLAIQVKALESNEAIGFSFTDIETFDSRGVIQKSLYKNTGEFTGSVFPQMLWNQLIICHTTLLLRASCLEKIGPMDEAMRSGDHDRVFYLSRYFNAYVIYRSLVRVRKHSQNSTGNPAVSLRQLEEHHTTLHKFYRQNLISTKEYERACALTSYSFGVQLLAAGNHSAARRYFYKCLTHDPLHWKAAIRLALVLPKQIIRF
jgi:glycosyltransferase involved in cell wall biosynthesis